MRKLVCLIGLVFTAVLLHPGHMVGQSFASLSGEVRRFVSVDSPVFALTNVRVVDGTGAAARDAQTVIVMDGLIRDVGPTEKVSVPEGAEIVGRVEPLPAIGEAILVRINRLGLVDGIGVEFQTLLKIDHPGGKGRGLESAVGPGGGDLVRELHSRGELKPMVDAALEG